MSQGNNNNSFIVHLLNQPGVSVDIATTSGADAFLKQFQQGKNEFNNFSANIGVIANKIRKKSRRQQKKKGSGGCKLSAQDKNQLAMSYAMADCLAGYGTLELFAKTVPNKEFEVWVDHAVTELTELAKDKKWKETGNLEQHDNMLLNSCISMFMYFAPTVLAFEKGLFKALADFVAARAGTGAAPLMPTADISDTVARIVANALQTSILYFGPDWTAEKTFKKLESSGILVQFIRCSTTPMTEYDGNGIYNTYDELMKCTALIQNKCKKGEPCGDVIRAILVGKDGHKPSSRGTIQKLKALASYSGKMQPASGDITSHKMCRYCSKTGYTEEFQNSLKACARCKITH